MRRSTLALSSSLAAIGLSASIALGQQLSPASAPGAASPSSADSLDPSMAARPTRYLLRNGLDYLAYREYARALSFFRVVETRQGELNDLELKQLKNGIARAQQGLREAVNGNNKAVAQAKGRPGVQPGAFALAKPASNPAKAQASASAKAPTDPLLLASAEMPAPPPLTPVELPTLPPPSTAPDALAEPGPAQAPAPAPSGPAPPVFGIGATRQRSPFSEPAPAPAPEPTQSEPVAPAPAPTVDAQALPAQAPSSVELPPSLPPPSSAAPELPPTLEPASPAPSPTPAPSPSPSPVELPPTVPSGVELPPTVSPPVPMTAESAPSPVEPSSPEPVQPRAAVASRPEVPAEPTQLPSLPASAPAPAPEPLPAPEAQPAPEGRSMPSPAASTTARDLGTGSESGILPPRLLQEVERIAQRPTPDDRLPGTATDPSESPTANPGSPRLDIPRAPSPTEARPLRRIPVPEEFVNLGKREWEPNRKYWAAAGTCHMILYFQDPVLERYGQGVEQALGPIGRYFSYPLDDPKQSNQRNQILQPFYSMGKLCFQVGTLPYKLIVDPPWEAEYDLGYYRPGDRIPPDTIMITPYGVGPPLKGRQY